MCKGQKDRDSNVKIDNHDYNPDIRRVCWIARLCGLCP